MQHDELQEQSVELRMQSGKSVMQFGEKDFKIPLTSA